MSKSLKQIYISHCVILKYTLSKHIHINRQHSDKSRRGYSYQLSFRHPACRTHTGVSTNISAGKQWTVHIVYIYATDPNNRTQYTIRSIHGQRNPHPKRGEVGTDNGAMALRCCVALACLRFALFVKQRHVFSSFSRGSSCRNRVDIQKPSWYSFTVKDLQVESWMIGDILSVYGEIKI